MEERINQVLTQIENDLRKINSARNQVESTINASAELQKVVEEYVSSVNILCKGLQSWESDLKASAGALSKEYEAAISRINTSCSDVIKTFETVVEQTSTDFKSNTGNIIDKFTEQNSKLAESIKELNTFRDVVKKATDEIESIKETLSQISKDLKDSQEGQDAVLNEINKKNDAIHTVLSEINNDCLNIITTTAQLKDSLQSSKEQITKEIKELKGEALRSININRWIIIGGVIVLVILHFLLK